MNDVPDALVKRGAAAQEPWRTVLSTEDRKDIAHAVLAAVWPDLAEEKRRAIDAALILAAAQDDPSAARPVVDVEQLAEHLWRYEGWSGEWGSADRHASHMHTARELLAALDVQDAADVRRAVAEEIAAAIEERWFEAARTAREVGETP